MKKSPADQQSDVVAILMPFVREASRQAGPGSAFANYIGYGRHAGAGDGPVPVPCELLLKLGA